MNSSQFKRPVDELQQERIKKQRFDVEGNPFSSFCSKMLTNISNAS